MWPMATLLVILLRIQRWAGSVQLPLLLASTLHACGDNCTFLNHPIRPTSGWSMSRISNAKEEFEIPFQSLFCLFPSALLFKMWFAILPPGELFSLLASHPSSTLPPALSSFSPFPDCELFRRLSPRQVYVHKAQSVQTCLQGRPNTRQAVARHRRLHQTPYPRCCHRCPFSNFHPKSTFHSRKRYYPLRPFNPLPRSTKYLRQLTPHLLRLTISYHQP
jgi:hypothetical protein